MLDHVSVTEQGTNLKFEWSGPRHVLSPYCVNAEQVRTAGQLVRDELQTIAEKYRAYGASYDGQDLRALAVAGQKLYAALFLVTAGDETSADYLKDKLESKRERSDLHVFTDGNVTIPWSFIFLGDPYTLSTVKSDLSDFDGFWTSIFRTSIRFNKMQPPNEAPISKSRLKTLLALHKDRFRDAQELLRTDNEIAPKLAALLDREIGEVTNWVDCRSKWKTIADSDSVIYIFGHSDGKRLFLRDPPREKRQQDEVRDEFTLDTLGLLTTFPKRKGNTSSSIYFINGCRTADTNLGNGFLSVTSGPGFHGFIGCEAEITNEFATRYAAEFLDLLCEAGMPVSDCVEALRTKLFPLSLWYSCYADPGFRIA